MDVLSFGPSHASFERETKHTVRGQGGCQFETFHMGDISEIVTYYGISAKIYMFLRKVILIVTHFIFLEKHL